jgi:hypothetical protein
MKVSGQMNHMKNEFTAEEGNDDAAWEKLLSDPSVMAETEKIGAQIREAAAKSGLGSILDSEAEGKSEEE